MPLVVYLVHDRIETVRRGDMVFHIADHQQGEWEPRLLVHTGIAEETTEEFELRRSASVIHMECFVSRDKWACGEPDGGARVDACGTHPFIDDLTRERIIHEANVFYELAPSIFQGQGRLGCYWMGDPFPSGHPLYPRALNTYGFTCANFAHECYLRADVPIVDTSMMPLMTDDERRELVEQFPVLEAHMQPGPFPRLYPSYLMHAFQRDEYPFAPEDWQFCKQHECFIPDDAAD